MENITTTPTPPPATGGKHTLLAVVVIFIIVVVIITLAVYVNFWQKTEIVLVPENTADMQAEQNVGADIYNQAQNPIQDKIEETSAPVANPIGDAYVNPF